jgi:hypothetical protein
VGRNTLSSAAATAPKAAAGRAQPRRRGDERHNLADAGATCDRSSAREVERRGWGLLKRRNLSPAVETVLAVGLMDYTFISGTCSLTACPRCGASTSCTTQTLTWTPRRPCAFTLPKWLSQCLTGLHKWPLSASRSGPSRLADVPVRLDPVSPFESAPAGLVGASPCYRHRDAAHARHSPLDG